MHESSMRNMEKFITKYLNKTGIVLDIGSLDTNGNYKGLFKDWKYTGVDILAGTNVDMVLDDPYKWVEFKDEHADAIISGQYLEHVKYPKRIMAEISRVLKVGGVCCIVAPSDGGVMDHGLRKYQIEDFKKLAKEAGLKVLECYIDMDSTWDDCVLIAKKEGAKSEVEPGLREPKTKQIYQH